MKLKQLYRLIQKSESIGLLCNQSGWNGEYSFQWLARTGRLTKVFIPEHGLFAELQDQVKLDDTTSYKNFGSDIEWISLYNSTNHNLTATEQQLSSIDTLIIDIQDTGSRYYTFTSTVWLLLEKISELNHSIRIIVLDKPNPAGRQAEGTRIKKEYASFIGIEGLPHRHGLTIAELCRYFKNKLNASWELLIVPADKKDYTFIAPSPNIPTTKTCTVYSGQCLWEGTNISEGRGTTLPFEIIGAPFLNWVFSDEWNKSTHPAFEKNCQVRPLRYIPVFHKYANEVCHGLQLLPVKNKKYHSLSHSLRLMKYIKDRSSSFEWRPGSYEAFNNKKAIELLIGDSLLLDYLNDKVRWKEVKSKMQEEENNWIKEAKPFLIYKSSLQQLKIN